jgi:small subunit ribosomal protein S16
MVRIRLRRVGAKHQASYRIVAADKESPRDGRFLEILGHYNPRTQPASVEVDEARLFHWLSRGAQPSESVRQVLRSRGTWDRWERHKQGEALGTLLAEAAASAAQVDPRTERPGAAAPASAGDSEPAA